MPSSHAQAFASRVVTTVCPPARTAAGASSNPSILSVDFLARLALRVVPSYPISRSPSYPYKSMPCAQINVLKMVGDLQSCLPPHVQQLVAVPSLMLRLQGTVVITTGTYMATSPLPGMAHGRT